MVPVMWHHYRRATPKSGRGGKGFVSMFVRSAIRLLQDVGYINTWILRKYGGLLEV